MTITVPLPSKTGGGSGGGGGSHPSPSPSHSSSGGTSSVPRPSGGNTTVIIHNHAPTYVQRPGFGYHLPGYRPPGYYPRPRYGGLSPFWHPPMIYHPWYHPVFFWTPRHYIAGDVSILQWICTILVIAFVVGIITWAVRR